MEALDAFFRAKVKNAAVPEIEQGISAAVQTFMGIMVNDPVLAEQLALDPTTPINYQEFLRLRGNPLFTDPNYFNGFTYFEDLSILYFDQIGPGGLLYSDWTPEYYHAYHWGVLNSLNGYSTYYEQRSDIL